jgi:hypothetical protein
MTINAVDITVRAGDTGVLTPLFTNAFLVAGAGSYDYAGSNVTETTPNLAPDQFTFFDVSNVPLGQPIESNIITLSGITPGYASPLSWSGDASTEYQVNSSGVWISGFTDVYNGDTVQVRHNSSGNNNTKVNSIITIGGISDTFTSTTEADAGAWILPADHSISIVPMMVIYPHPDAGVNARHLWAHTAFEYRIPVGVRGGAYPYRYELLSHPPGATIGEEMDRTIDPDTNQTIHTPGEFYGVIRWTPGGAPRTESFSVLVTDQNGDTKQLDWDVAVDDTKFTIIDSSVGASNPAGTWANPLKTIDDWQLGSDTDNTYVNQIIVFKSGTYPFTATHYWSDRNRYSIQFAGSYKSRAIIGVPDAYPKIIMDTGSWTLGDGNSNDLFIAGLDFDGYQITPNQEKDSVHIDAGKPGYRQTFFDNIHQNMELGTVGDDNPGALVALGDATTGVGINYLYSCRNTYERMHLSGRNGSFTDIYNCSDLLIEHETATVGNATSFGYLFKTPRDSITLRHNEIDNNGYAIYFSMALDPGSKPPGIENNEFCYNKTARYVTAGSSCLAISIGSSGVEGGNNSAYRNTFIGGPSAARDFSGGAKEPIKMDGNVLMSNSMYSGDWQYGEAITETLPLDSPGGLVGLGNAGYADLNTGNLIGTYRDDYLGRVGYEIAGL